MTPGLAEWARTGGLTLTGQGGLLGKLTKWSSRGGWMTTWAMRR